MSALHALQAARAIGIEVRLDGQDLVVSAIGEPPSNVLEMLRRHKPSIVALLQCGSAPIIPCPVDITGVPSTEITDPSSGRTTSTLSGDTTRSAGIDVINSTAAAVAATADSTSIATTAAAGSAPIASTDDVSTGSADTIANRPTQKNVWSAKDWQGYFDENAGLSEFEHGLPRPEAEALAFNYCLVEWLGRNRVYSPSGRCLLCAEPARPNDALLCVGLGFGPGQAWLHRGCIPAWRSGRMHAAVEALKAMNIEGAPAAAGIDITGSTTAAAGTETAAFTSTITGSGTDVVSSPSGATDVAILPQTQEERSSTDWQTFFDQQVRIHEGFERARPEAEASAFDDAVAEWLRLNLVVTQPGPCPVCGDRDRASDPLVSTGIIGGRYWLRARCRKTWCRAQKATAVAALAAKGLTSPAGGSP